jgi:hypothetical protein
MDASIIAAATVIEAVAVVAAVIYAKRQLKEFRDAREETTRPFVVIDLETARTIATLKVRNIGQTIARNVTFRFTPPIESTFDSTRGGGQYILGEIELFARGLPSLAPGRELSTLLDQVPARIEAGLPSRYDVDVSYDGPNGKRYTDRQVVSLDALIGLTRVERKDVHDAAKSLEDIRDEIKRWTALGRGLRVVTEADLRRRHEALMETRAKRNAEGESDAPQTPDDGTSQAAP